MMNHLKRTLSCAVLIIITIISYSQREIQSLNGTWDIEESVKGKDMPGRYSHTVPVPALAHNASPGFEDIDQFQSKEYIGVSRWLHNLPHEPWMDTIKTGISHQKRNFFWYHTSFNPGNRREMAILKISKAQFGIAVWLNGRKIGDYQGCFQSVSIDVSKNIAWQINNELVIRVGAHPGVMPANVPSGTDCEKRLWTPGIYDDVSLITCDNPYIESVQIAPDINRSRAKIEMKIKNYSPLKKVVSLNNTIHPWKKQNISARGLPQTFLMEGGETKTITEEIRIDSAVLWSPENPFLYVLETSTGGDTRQTRFGMREFRFDTKTKRAYLNNKIIFMRGSNITLHRFFEDSLCGLLPWTEPWVRKILTDIPRRMNWNTFRFSIGPVPDKWLDICDETGLLIQNEYFIWGYRSNWDNQEVKRQIKGWVADNWNHPSVVIWDICNETNSEELADMLPEVRKTDLSARPWENAYHLPDDENDPVNDHHYFMYYNDTMFFKNNPHHIWSMENFQKWTGEKSTNSAHPSSHAVILNEYGWLWLQRNGNPTLPTVQQFNALAPNSTAAERIEKAAYMLATETEYFRAHRNYAAIMHFVYLTVDHPLSNTSDLFIDLEKAELNPVYEKYFKEAFKPLGVYLNFTQDTLALQENYPFVVMMVNDEYKTMQGRIEVSVTKLDGTVLFKESKPFGLSELSSHSYQLKVRLPLETGHYYVKAIAYYNNNQTTTSLRTLSLYKPKNYSNE